MDRNARQRDTIVRTLAFDWLERQVSIHGDVLARDLLLQGFEFEGKRVGLISPAQGIFKPRVMPRWPLTITTSPNSPYADNFADEHHLLYKYRGNNPQHPDNVGLREAGQLRLPLLYLIGIRPSRYLAVWPVYVVKDNPGALTFTVMADDRRSIPDQLEEQLDSEKEDDAKELRRRYFTAAVRQRAHQRTFRELVLDAYQNQCAMCRLRHRELLDAGHIIPDAEETGEPVVSNGLALCKIHHAAFDRNIIGIRPDYRMEVREDILAERDGPMLRYGLQALHEENIQVPSNESHRPAREALELRYERFIS